MKRMILLLVVLALAVWGQGRINKKVSTEWKCTPPAEEAKAGVVTLSRAINGVPYRCTEEGKLVIDDEAVQSQRQRHHREKKLYEALRTRVLTDKEMAEVLDIGWSITLDWMNSGISWPYKEEERRREFDEAIYQQTKLRLLHEAAKNNQTYSCQAYTDSIVPGIPFCAPHRWASDLVKEKRKDGTVWRIDTIRIWRETPDCNYCTPDGNCTLMYCPADIHEAYEVDVCLEHGETRVLPIPRSDQE